MKLQNENRSIDKSFSTFLLSIFERGSHLLMVAFAAILLASTITTNSANAQTPQQLLKPHVDWIKNSNPGYGDYWVNLVFVSNSTPIAYLNNMQSASYGVARLYLKASANLLYGTANIYYSYKKTSTGNPFDQNQAISTTVTINIITGQVTLGSIVIDAPQCGNGLMFGFCRPFLSQQYYVLSFTDQYQERIK
jgi:hypothetical protein